MTTPDLAQRLCHHITTLGTGYTWHERLTAAHDTLDSTTQHRVEVPAVRAVAYSRAARHQLAGSLIVPTSAHEAAYLRQQFGHTITILEPHALLLVDGHVIELADSADHAGRGPLLQPHAATPDAEASTWTTSCANDLTTIAYRRDPTTTVTLARTPRTRQLTMLLAGALRHDHQRPLAA